MPATQTDPSPSATVTDEGPPTASASAVGRNLWASKAFQGSITFVAFLVLFAGYAVWLGDVFTTTDARVLDIHQNVPVLILGLSVLFTLVAGQFDLSVASMATLTSFFTVGLAVNQGWPFGLVLVFCIVLGAVGGVINGLLVMRLRINTFIATLGTGGVFAGISAVYSKGTQITPGSDGGALPTWFSGPGSLGSVADKFPGVVLWVGLAVAAALCVLSARRRRPTSVAPARWDATIVVAGVVVVALLFALGLPDWVGAVSWTIAVLLIVALVLWLLLDHTTFGRYVRAVGSNPSAATLTGIDPAKETVKAFVIGGVLAALAGVLLAASQGTASPDAGAPFLLPAFAAAFLSTVILSTGRFHVWGTVIGGSFLVWVSQGLIVGGLPFTWTAVVNGVVLVLAVAFSTVFRRNAA